MTFKDHAFLAAFASFSRRIADPDEAAEKAWQYAEAASARRVPAGPTATYPDEAARVDAPEPEAATVTKPAPRKRGRPPKIRKPPPTVDLAGKE